MLVLCMHKQKSHKWSRNSCAQLVWFIYLLNETTGLKMTCIAHVPSTLHFLKDWKFELDHLQGEGRNYLLMEKTGCCLFLLHKLCPGSLTSVPTWLCFHHWPHTCSLIRRDGERGPRCRPSFALQAVPEMQLAVIQLGSAEGCRLLDETPGQWQLIFIHCKENKSSADSSFCTVPMAGSRLGRGEKPGDLRAPPQEL